MGELKLRKFELIIYVFAFYTKTANCIIPVFEPIVDINHNQRVINVYRSILLENNLKESHLALYNIGSQIYFRFSSLLLPFSI